MGERGSPFRMLRRRCSPTVALALSAWASACSGESARWGGERGRRVLMAAVVARLDGVDVA